MDASYKAGHVACYGNVQIERSYCECCQRFAFVIDGILQCCDSKVVGDAPRLQKRMSDVPLGRRKPGMGAQRVILKEQDHKCFYCLRRFGTKLWYKSRCVVLRVTWDHVSPYTYSLNNKSQNFVAACHICNRLKSHMIFNSVEEARVYLANRETEKGYSDLPPVRKELPPETQIAKVL